MVLELFQLFFGIEPDRTENNFYMLESVDDERVDIEFYLASGYTSIAKSAAPTAPVS